MLEAHLQAAGYESLQAASGEEALTLAAAESFDLILVGEIECQLLRTAIHPRLGSTIFNRSQAKPPTFF